MQPEIGSKHDLPCSIPLSTVIQLQQSLSYEKLLISSQNQQKSKFRQNIQDWLKHYFNSYTNIIKHKTNNPRIRLSDQDIYGNTYNFVKEVILLLSKDYSLILYLLQNQPQTSDIKQLLPLIINVLYQNSIDDNFVHKDITKLMTQILLKSFKNQLNLLQTSAIKQFTNRPQCRRYGQIVSKSILLVLSSSHETQKKIKSVIKYTKQSFPQINISNQFPVITTEEQEYNYLINNYLQTIVSSEFHVPVCMRILMKSIDNKKEEVNILKLVELFWSMLFQIYEQALKFPQDESFRSSVLLAHKQLSLFKQYFSKLKNYNQLSSTHQQLIKQFILKLLILPSNIVQQFESPPVSQLKLYSACISVEQTIILLKCLHSTPGLKQLNQKISVRVNRIRQMSEEFTDFCKNSPHNQVYCIFYQLILPKQLDVDYMKKYQQLYANRKLQSLIRQILVTIQPLQVYLSSFKVKTLRQLLARISTSSEQQQNTNPDKVAFYVSIKYFLWMSEKINIDQNIMKMFQEVKTNHQQWLSLFSKTKIHFTNALYYLKGYHQRLSQIDHKLKQTNLMLNVQEYLANFSFNLCVSSPSSRSKQFQTSGKLMIINHEKILLQKWQNCVHHKMKLKGQLDKMLHVKNFNQMIQAFCHLDQVKSSIETGIDKVSINMNFYWFLSHIYQQAAIQNMFKKNSKQFKDYLQIIATKKIYNLIFPKNPTVKDIDISNKLHYFRLLQPKHLGLDLKQIAPLWQLINKLLNDLDKSSSTIKKFQYLREFMKVINGILLVNQQNNKNKLELIILYALLKSNQKMLASNIYFMETFTDPARMVSAEGAFIASIKAALRQLQELTFSKLKDMDEIAYNKQFQRLEKEMEQKQTIQMDQINTKQ